LLHQIKDPEHIQYLKVIKESDDYPIEIVNDILGLSKIEPGKLVLNIVLSSPRGNIAPSARLPLANREHRGRDRPPPPAPPARRDAGSSALVDHGSSDAKVTV
jgi:hypothetical protein